MKVNKEELSRKLNTFRLENAGKSFTREEMLNKMKEMGFNSLVAPFVLKHIPHETIGKSNLYTMDKYNNIHIKWIESAYKKCNDYKKATQKPIVTEEEALKVLSNRGYQIRKCVGFDMERFQKENPVLYKKYLKYETV